MNYSEFRQNLVLSKRGSHWYLPDFSFPYLSGVFLLFLDGKESFFSRKTNTFSKSFSLSKNTGFFSGLDASKWWKGCLILQPFKFYHHQHVCYKPATHAFKKPCLSLLRIKSYLFSWWS